MIRVIGVITLVILTLLLILGGSRVAGASEIPPPYPSYTVDQDVITWAQSKERAARRAREALCRVRRCLGDSAPACMPERPLRGADAAAWREFGRRCKWRARDWQAKAAAGVAKMRRPGGSGAARWWPLARFVGWTESARPMLMRVIGIESGGDPAAVNGLYLGLLQVWRGHVSRPGRLMDPAVNLRVGLRLYRDRGWEPWAL